MEAGLKPSAALLALVALTACPEIGTQREGAVSAQTPVRSAAQNPPPAFDSVAGHALRLVTSETTCVVEHTARGGTPRRLALDLRPPCYLLTWQGPPPAAAPAGSVSTGVPIGALGEPMAWRYAGAPGVIALAVIGDPVPDELRQSSLYKLRQQQGLRCAASVQGVLLRGDDAVLSKKRDRIGVLCAEIGLEERDFWILANP